MGFLPWLIVLLSVSLRLAKIHRPLLGHFSMYQTANAMMANFFLKNHFTTLFLPQVNVLAGGEPGLLLLAYPVNALVAACMKLTFGGSLDMWGRLQAVFFFMLSAVYLFRLVNRWIGSQSALISLVIFCLSPLTIIYGQSFQNEMATVFFSIAFLFYWDVFVKETQSLAACTASALFTALVLVTRPNALYLFIPAGYLLTKEVFWTGKWKSCWAKLILYAVIGAGIPALWFGHLWKVSETASNIYSTMFTQLEVRSSFISPLVLSLDYHQQLFDKLSGIALTPVGFTFFIAGCFFAAKEWKRYAPVILWCFTCFASSLLIPRKLIDHDFYLLHFLVPAAPIMAAAVSTLLDGFKESPRARRVFSFSMVIFSLIFSMRYALHPAFKTTEEDAHLLEIAAHLKEVTDPSSKIIVQGSHPVLYYADRHGWTFTLKRSGEVPEYYTTGNWERMTPEQRQIRNEALKNPIAEVEYRKKYEGATHFVVLNPKTFDEAREFSSYMKSHFKTVYEKPGVTQIYRLNEGV